MDPNANLEEMLKLANRIADYETRDGIDVSRLAELVLAMDGWLGRGGALPESWREGGKWVGPAREIV